MTAPTFHVGGRTRVAIVFFAGLAAILFAFSPASMTGMGYAHEEMQAARSLINATADILTGRPPDSPVVWARHGVLPILFDVPFILAGRVFPSRSEWEDRLLSLRPILFTAGIATLIFLWTRRVTSQLGWSLFVALAGVFCTMLWPYAYIGLEDKQSFFLLLSGYLAFFCDPFRSVRSTIFFGASVAYAVSSKSTGIFLLPAALFVSVKAWSATLFPKFSRGVTFAAILLCVYSLSAASRIPFWSGAGGIVPFLRYWATEGVFYYQANFVSLFFSANKGLFVYCPILLLVPFCIPHLWHSRNPALVFATLSIAGLALGLSFLRVWADETWGARYLHPGIAPLIVCIGAGWTWRGRRAMLTIIAAALPGFLIACLGSLFYYGAPHAAMTEAGQDTLEAIQADVVWSPLRFDARLFRILISPSHTPVLMTPRHQWYYQPPSPIPAVRSVDISKFAVPQPNVLLYWNAALVGVPLWWKRLQELSLLAGLVSMIYLFASANSHRRAHPGVPEPINST